MFFNIIAGLGIGLLGSLHCIGMCGPIALSLPVYGKSKVDKLLLIVLYNLGRASSYAALGALFGFIGNQFFLFGYQQAFSIILGVAILLFLVIAKYLPFRIPLIDSIHQKIKGQLAKLLQSPKQQYSYYFIGLANGLLPCGLVYLAIGSAMATGSAVSGALLMFMFGLGTFPLMMSIMIFGKFIPLPVRQKINRLTPVLISITACLIILRGMNLNIPYLSPGLEQHSTQSMQTIQCHK